MLSAHYGAPHVQGSRPLTPALLSNSLPQTPVSMQHTHPPHPKQAHQCKPEWLEPNEAIQTWICPPNNFHSASPSPPQRPRATMLILFANTHIVGSRTDWLHPATSVTMHSSQKTIWRSTCRKSVSYVAGEPLTSSKSKERKNALRVFLDTASLFLRHKLEQPVWLWIHKESAINGEEKPMQRCCRTVNFVERGENTLIGWFEEAHDKTSLGEPLHCIDREGRTPLRLLPGHSFTARQAFLALFRGGSQCKNHWREHVLHW